MSAFAAVFLLHLWTFGIPLAALTWATLRLTQAAPARVRYVVALLGFAAMIAMAALVTVAGVNPFASTPTATTAGGGAPAAGQSEWPLIAATIVVCTWAGGAVVLVVRELGGHLRLRLDRARYEAAPASTLADLGWPGDVPLLLDDDRPPRTIGLVRPVVVFPPLYVKRLPRALVDAMLRHELAHARWRDPLAHAAVRFVRALLWPSPLWLVSKWIERERELAADESALAETSIGAEYVSALVMVARELGTPRIVPAMASGDLSYRARLILRPAQWQLRALPIPLIVFIAGVAALSAAPAVQRPRTPAPIPVVEQPQPRPEASAPRIERLPVPGEPEMEVVNVVDEGDDAPRAVQVVDSPAEEIALPIADTTVPTTIAPATPESVAVAADAPMTEAQIAAEDEVRERMRAALTGSDAIPAADRKRNEITDVHRIRIVHRDVRKHVDKHSTDGNALRRFWSRLTGASDP